MWWKRWSQVLLARHKRTRTENQTERRETLTKSEWIPLPVAALHQLSAEAGCWEPWSGNARFNGWNWALTQRDSHQLNPIRKIRQVPKRRLFVEDDIEVLLCINLPFLPFLPARSFYHNTGSGQHYEESHHWEEQETTAWGTLLGFLSWSVFFKADAGWRWERWKYFCAGDLRSTIVTVNIEFRWKRR